MLFPQLGFASCTAVLHLCLKLGTMVPYLIFLLIHWFKLLFFIVHWPLLTFFGINITTLWFFNHFNVDVSSSHESLSGNRISSWKQNFIIPLFSLHVNMILSLKKWGLQGERELLNMWIMKKWVIKLFVYPFFEKHTRDKCSYCLWCSGLFYHYPLHQTTIQLQGTH